MTLTFLAFVYQYVYKLLVKLTIRSHLLTLINALTNMNQQWAIDFYSIYYALLMLVNKKFILVHNALTYANRDNVLVNVEINMN